MLGHDFDFQSSWLNFVYSTNKSRYWVDTTHHWNMAIVAFIQAVASTKVHRVSDLCRRTLWPSPGSQSMTCRIWLVHWLKNRGHNTELPAINLTSYVGIVNGTKSEQVAERVRIWSEKMTYKWPISWAIVKAVAKPVSSITVQDFEGEQIEYFSARPSVSQAPSEVHKLCFVM